MGRLHVKPSKHWKYKFQPIETVLLNHHLSRNNNEPGKVVFMRAHVGSIVLIGAVLLLGSLSGRASADSIALRDGRHVHGKFAGGTQGVIAFSVAGATQYYDVRDILVMTFEDEGETPGAERQQHTPAVPPVSLLPQSQKIQHKSSPSVSKVAKTPQQKRSVRMIMISSERAN
jgi:hypothetical protein